MYPADLVFSLTQDNQVGWIGTTVLILKVQIGLGVLAIPGCFEILGLVPGIICLLVVAIIATWSTYVVGIFKVNHPEVYGVNDVGNLIFGPIGREIFGFAFILCKFIPFEGFPRTKMTSIYPPFWFFNVGPVNCLERCLKPRDMYRGLCRSICHCGGDILEHSNTGPHELAGLGRRDQRFGVKSALLSPKSLQRH